MADISSITLPGGATYNIKDTTARNGMMEFLVDQNRFSDGSWVAYTADTALYNGKRVALMVATNTTVSPAYLKLIFPNSTDTGFIPVYNSKGEQVSPIPYKSGQIIHLTYVSSSNRWYLDRDDRNTFSVSGTVLTISNTY